MPELPEVETVRQTLLPEVRGRHIMLTEIFTPGILLNPAHLELFTLSETNDQGSHSGNQLADQDNPCLEAANLDVWSITGIERRGKYLIVRLVRNEVTGPFHASLLVHLRMTGRLLLKQNYDNPPRHTHVRFVLSASDQKLTCGQAAPEARMFMDFHDTRRFGRIWLLPESKNGDLLFAPPGFYRLGPEPLEPGFTRSVFTSHLRRRLKTPVKAALLDQTVVAGLGNIYADESLFIAGIQPQRLVSSLTDQETENLRRSIVDVLNKAISCQGTSLKDYVDGWNRKGRFQSCLMVYGRAGESCRRCGNSITKIFLAGRTTCFCPSCQN